MSMFDKNISEEKRKSLEFAEDAREMEWKHPSFALKLFHGDVDFDLIHPFPQQSAEERKIGDDYIVKMEKFLREKLDPNEVDRTHQISKEVMDGLGRLGAFAIKIPQTYGGLGFSQVNYNRVMHLISSYCGSTAVLLSAHQSIGVPQPLKLFGTEEQKKISPHVCRRQSFGVCINRTGRWFRSQADDHRCDTDGRWQAFYHQW